MEKNSLMRLYRVMHYLYKKKIPFFPGFISRLIRVIYSCELPPSVQIGRNTLFVHNGLGCVIHQDAIIGDNCKIYQNVSIAGRNNRGGPVIKDNVMIGCGACVLGGVIVEDDSMVGANAVVIHDVPIGCTVVGVPAMVVNK